VRVAEVLEFGGPEALRLAERPDPVPRAGEVVVAIRAANVNPADLGARSGQIRRRLPELEPPFVPGWDLVGEVVAVGEGATGYATGDRVVGMIPWIAEAGRVGAYAQAASVDPDWLAPAPEGLDDVTAATLPLNALTARQGLDLIAAPPGATLLVTGASGAVGAFAVQLAARDGLRVLAVASDGDEEWVGGLGPAEVLPRSADLATLGPIDALFDAVPVGPDASAAVRDGGVAFFTRSPGDFERAAALRVEAPLVHPDPGALRDLAADLAAGRLRTRVAEVLDLGQAADAHALVERGGLRGKVVLALGDG
jgi:NADPH:quinone reductase-like Zn-dependent oxidoreductase